jgi:hypothetical protein
MTSKSTLAECTQWHLKMYICTRLVAVSTTNVRKMKGGAFCYLQSHSSQDQQNLFKCRVRFSISSRGANFDPGVKLSPRGELGSSVHPFILLNITECSPLWGERWGNHSPLGQSSPLGANFTPGGQLHPMGPSSKSLYLKLRSLAKP